MASFQGEHAVVDHDIASFVLLIVGADGQGRLYNDGLSRQCHTQQAQARQEQPEKISHSQSEPSLPRRRMTGDPPLARIDYPQRCVRLFNTFLPDSKA